jgi:hypothetical protein
MELSTILWLGLGYWLICALLICLAKKILP